MKYIYTAVLLIIINFCYARAEILDENDFSEKYYEPVFINQSILECGGTNHFDVYSSFDIEVLLSISKAISSTKVNLETNWENFLPPSFTSANFNENEFNTLPSDIRRILFLCLAWNESDRLKLFTIPDSALENITTRLREERPWKNLDAKLVKKIDNLSDTTLKEFIYIVLRADVFESVRGDLLNNKSLWFIPWDWLTANQKG